MNFFSSSNFCTSPGIPLSKYECSPIITVEKYKILSKAYEGSSIGINATSRLVNFQNGMTPFAKDDNMTLSNLGKSQNSYNLRNFAKESSELKRKDIKSNLNKEYPDLGLQELKNNCTVSHSQVIKFPLNSTCSLLQKASTTHCSSLMPKVISSLRKESSLTNIFLSYPLKEETKDTPSKSIYKINSNLSFKKLSSSQKSEDDTLRKEFRLNEIVVNGNKINFLFNQEMINVGSIEIDPNYVELIQPLYEKNFKKLNNLSYSSYSEDKEYENFNEIMQDIYSVIYYKNFRNIFLNYNEKNQPQINENLKRFEKRKTATKRSLVSFYQKSISNFKSTLLNIQKDYILNFKKELTKNHIKKLQNLINESNKISLAFYQSYIKYKERMTSSIKKEKIIKSQRKDNVNYNYDCYDCKFCDRNFNTGQGLGGHMSRVHPNQSTQYKNKMNIREGRSEQREILYEAKRRLLKIYGYNYDELIENSQKKFVKQLVFKNRKEYREILSLLKSDFQKEGTDEIMSEEYFSDSIEN
jgi:hypothetical protein